MITRPARFLATVDLGSLALAVAAPLRAAEEAPWENLFNGQDLAGWVSVHDTSFEVKDGHLRLLKGMGWLRTEKKYGDFILELEWRALEKQYDSGIFIRCPLEGKPWPKDGWQFNQSCNVLGPLVRDYKVCAAW